MRAVITLVLGLAIGLARPASAGPIEDAFAAFIDRLRAQGQAIVEGAMPGGWGEARTASLERRVDKLPLGHDQFVIFVAPGCWGCREARKALDQQGMPVEELDVTASKTAREAYALAQGQGLPVLLIGGHRLTGWSPRLFKEAQRRALLERMGRQQGQGG